MSDAEAKSHKQIEVETILEALESRSSDRITAIAEEAHPGDVEQAFERLVEGDRVEVLDSLPV